MISKREQTQKNILVITNPFEKGDYVTVNGESGTIKGMGSSVTSLDTPDNKRVVIPNGQIGVEKLSISLSTPIDVWI